MNNTRILENRDTQGRSMIIGEFETERHAAQKAKRFAELLRVVHQRMRADELRQERQARVIGWWCLAGIVALLVLPLAIVWLATRWMGN